MSIEFDNPVKRDLTSMESFDNLSFLNEETSPNKNEKGETSKNNKIVNDFVDEEDFLL